MYKVCIAIENSIAVDYLSEKLFDALDAGCIPIYYGAPNILELLPAPEASIVVKDLTQDGLDEMVREVAPVLEDPNEFARRQRWRTLPYEQLSPVWRNLMHVTTLPPTECQMCSKIVEFQEQNKQGNYEIDVEFSLSSQLIVFL